MFVALAAGTSHPVVAAWLGLGAAGLAAVVVAMAWNVNARQIRLAEQLARRQFLVTGRIGAGIRGGGNGIAGANGAGSLGADGGTADIEMATRQRLDPAAREQLEAAARGAAEELARGRAQGAARGPAETAARARAQGAARGRRVPPDVIEGPEEVVAGEQARYRVQATEPHQVVSWAVGGGPVSHAPDPDHPEDLLLIADQPGVLSITARVREGLTERRATKSVTAVPDVATVTAPFTLRLFLHGWGLVVVAVLIVGFAGALDALGNFTSSDFIALAVPLAALLGVMAVARGQGEAGGRPGKRHPLG